MAVITLSSVLEHFEKFIRTHRLIDEKDNVLIGISGGVDSVFLAFLISHLQKQNKVGQVSWLYCDHGTRKDEIKKEIAMLKQLSKKWNAEFIVEKLSCQFKKSNFENEARLKRYQKYALWSEMKNAVVLLGHHIDDSFEWSLMQQFKSSNPNSSLGIPVKNSIYRRPLMCFTKQQIADLADKFKLHFLMDSSNDNPRFERNFIRNNIIPEIRSRFPSFLKHYVERANRQAMQMGKHCLSDHNANDIVIHNPCEGIFTIEHRQFKNDFTHAKEKIYMALHQLSSSKRGSLRQQVNKLIEAARNGKVGPLVFSGNVKAAIIPGVIFLFNAAGENKMRSIDVEASKIVGKVDEMFLRQQLLLELGTVAYSPIHYLYLGATEQNWPKHKQFRPLRKSHPLMPLTGQELLNKGIFWQWSTRFFALGLNK